MWSRNALLDWASLFRQLQLMKAVVVIIPSG